MAEAFERSELSVASGLGPDILRAQWQQVRARLLEEFGEPAYRSWLHTLDLSGVVDGVVWIEVPSRFMRDWVTAHYADRIRALWFSENKTISRVEYVLAQARSGTPRPDSGAAARELARHDLAPGDLATSEPAGRETDLHRRPELRATGRGGPRGLSAGIFGEPRSIASQEAAEYPLRPALRVPATVRPAARDGVREGTRDGARESYDRGNALEGDLGLAEAPAGEGVLEAETVREVSGPLEQRFTFEDFVVGKPNELAHAAARRVAEAAVASSRQVPFNPLFLYGGVGLGKTHLMHAIAWHIRRFAPQRRVIYISAEKFMYRFVRALRFRGTMEFKEQFRSVDVLMIDDLQFIAGKESTQEEFFHTFNDLVDQNRQVVVSADKSPSNLDGMEERMKSRLGWGLVADIHPTTYELRLGILQSKAEQHRQEIPPKVLEFLAHKITSNVRELEGALTRITAHAQLIGRAITLESAQDVLHDVLRASDRRVSIEDIQKRVSEHFNIRQSEMSSARRARVVARPRQVAMYLAKQLTQRSLPEIGRMFGNRDHTTVIHAVRKIEELMALDPGLAEDVELLRRMLES